MALNEIYLEIFGFYVLWLSQSKGFLTPDVYPKRHACHDDNVYECGVIFSYGHPGRLMCEAAPTCNAPTC